MTAWGTFAAFVGVVLTALLSLSRLSQRAVRDTDSHRSLPRDGTDPGPEERPAGESGVSDTAPAGSGVFVPLDEEPQRDPTPSLSTPALLANVAVSQGLFGVLLLAGVWYAEVPLSALSLGPPTLTAVGLGVGVGLALAAANEVGGRVGERLGFGGGAELREALAPDNALGWAVLLLVVLPVIAGFEELLFRGALVGALSTGFGVSPWLLAAGSSVAFGLGHGAQGRLGVAVTALLGFVLASVFVLTGSLLVVVLAHYLVNALEFVVHEGPGERFVPGD